jgi:hypothetical protein
MRKPTSPFPGANVLKKPVSKPANPESSADWAEAGFGLGGVASEPMAQRSIFGA